MNTEITYQYRDGANYKTHATIVVQGTLSKVQVDGLFEHFGDAADGFIPGLIGLDDLQSKFLTDDGDTPSWDDQYDHPWHSIIDVRATDREATIDTTAVDLLHTLETTDWVDDYRPPFYDAMVNAYNARRSLILDQEF